MTDGKIEKLASGMKFVEGPAWVGDYLIFSDIPADEMKRWSRRDGLKTFRSPSNQANGSTTDLEGRLITCEHASRRVTRTERDGAVTVLVDSFEGKRFNSPNDVVVKSDGTIWFTDPPYGLPKGAQRELDKNYVFCFDPEKKSIRIVASDFDMPNGLCFSPDEKLLYIADSGKPHHVRVFDVTNDNTLKSGKVFCTIDRGVPDGMRVDEHGHLWSSAGDGVHVFSPDGTLVQKVAVPETPANLCFGGEDGQTLLITARTSLYCLQTDVRAAQRPMRR